MKTLVIHEMREEFFDYPLENYILTFDDALYSQYYYLPLINKISTKKIFFVCVGLIGGGDRRDQFSGDHKLFPSCYDAMRKWRESNNNYDYMNVEELKCIEDEIGAHGYSHLNDYGTELYTQVYNLQNDNQKMFEWFDKNLGIRPTKFAFPHYIEPKFGRLIQKRHFDEVFVDERTTIEKEFDL